MGPGDIFLIEAFRTNRYILGLMDDALNSNAIHTYSAQCPQNAKPRQKKNQQFLRV